MNTNKKFVPDSFEIPLKLKNERFHIYPLKPEHCSLDYEAVMSSVPLLKGSFIYHSSWPEEDMTFEKDLSDLEYHEQEFKNRTSFTYTVLNTEENKCLGCVYIYPSRKKDFDADIFMWVTQIAHNEGLYKILHETIKGWMDNVWPFQKINYTSSQKFTSI